MRASLLVALGSLVLLCGPAARGGAAEPASPPPPATAGEAKPPAEAEPKLETLLPGVWRGTHTAGGDGYQHRIEVRKQGGGYVAAGLTWFAIGAAQAKAASEGRADWLPAWRKQSPTPPICVAQTFAVELKDEALTFRSVEVRPLLASGSKYFPDVFTGTLKRPGVFSGTATDTSPKRPPAKGGKVEDSSDGIFTLCKEEVWNAVPELAVEKHKFVKLECLDTTRYHYTVYVPKSYDPQKPAPIAIYFSPGGNAGAPFYDLAEEFGWITLGLTESQNGPWKPITENRDAVMFDLRRRFNVNWARVYFAGFSGGARSAAHSACTYPDLCAGLALTGAAYGGAVPPLDVPIFYIAGKTDMNNAEVQAAYDQAQKAGRQCQLIIHPGGHDGGRREDGEAAFRWLEEMSKAHPKPEVKPPAVPAPPVASPEIKEPPKEPPKAPPPPPTIAPEWDARLLALLRQETAAGRRPRTHVSALGDRFSVTAVDAKDNLSLSGEAAAMALPWARFTAGEKAALAAALAREDNPEGCCTAAYFLFKDGKKDQAEELLRKVKDESKAQAVRAAAQ